MKHLKVDAPGNAFQNYNECYIEQVTLNLMKLRHQVLRDLL